MTYIGSCLQYNKSSIQRELMENKQECCKALQLHVYKASNAAISWNPVTDITYYCPVLQAVYMSSKCALTMLNFSLPKLSHTLCFLKTIIEIKVLGQLHALKLWLLYNQSHILKNIQKQINIMQNIPRSASSCADKR